MNISSIVVQCKQENYDNVRKLLEESGLCDYHFGDKSVGKIIITIEGEGVDDQKTDRDSGDTRGHYGGYDAELSGGAG